MNYTEKETQILNETTNFCESECGNVLNCAEEECILFRIEKIITGEDNDRKRTNTI